VLAQPRWQRIIGVLALAALYRGTAPLGSALQFAGPVAAVVWLPVGVGIAFLYLGGLRFWPGVVIGDLLANDYSALPLGTALGTTAGNVLEVIAATLLLRRLVPDGDPLASVRGLSRMFVALGVATVVSAVIGTCASFAGGVIVADDIPRVWRTWWLGDFCGALLVLPLALAWAQPLGGWSRRRLLETVGAVGAVALLSFLALRTSESLTYVVFPALLWAALRLDRRGATLAVAVAGGFAIFETTRRIGPFAFESITESVLATQLYIAVAALSTLCVAAVVAERQAGAASLAASRARIVEAGARERRRIEQDLHDGAQQRLTALSVRLRMAAERAREEPSTGAGALEAAEIQLVAAIEELRELAHGIHPSALTDDGLGHALARLAADSPIALHLLEQPRHRVDATTEVTAYFVAAEAITNARKHARATSIDVMARNLPGFLRIEVRDNGIGGADEAGGSGLQGLRDRVEAIGGRFEISSREHRGTAIVALLPAQSRD
jgi:signal transduction histidine kinase